ncbi:hypothetical protein MLPF_0945 [Mycobacterium lepromatosis]|nr:hypothetical protein MLPF_0945 [Mycobacterium lepromatosis]
MCMNVPLDGRTSYGVPLFSLSVRNRFSGCQKVLVSGFVVVEGREVMTGAVGLGG